MDIEDLKTAIEGGASIEEAAEFLCRANTLPASQPLPSGVRWLVSGYDDLVAEWKKPKRVKASVQSSPTTNSEKLVLHLTPKMARISAQVSAASR
jgi:hypothetical protein